MEEEEVMVHLDVRDPHSFMPSRSIDELVFAYVFATRTDDVDRAKELEDLMMKIVSSSEVSERNFKALVLPPLRSSVNGYRPEMGGYLLALVGLMNPACPPDVLSYACREAHVYFALKAARHPNCRDEDAVYASLRENPLPSK